MTNKRDIASELENRKHNLQVIQEAIQADGRSGQKLLSVKEYLSSRIQTLEQELEA